jgi:hypothetical protein
LAGDGVALAGEQQLARLSLKSPEYIAVHEQEQYATPKNLQQNYLVCQLHEKLDTLFSFLKTHTKQKILVFISSCKQVPPLPPPTAHRHRHLMGTRLRAAILLTPSPTCVRAVRCGAYAIGEVRVRGLQAAAAGPARDAPPRQAEANDAHGHLHQVLRAEIRYYLPTYYRRRPLLLLLLYMPCGVAASH